MRESSQPLAGLRQRIARLAASGDRAVQVVERVAGALARNLGGEEPFDDALGRGGINPVKTWWWDIELDRRTGGYVRAAQTNRRSCAGPSTRRAPGPWWTR